MSSARNPTLIQTDHQLLAPRWIATKLDLPLPVVIGIGCDHMRLLVPVFKE
jgi:hypothetical protein